jgi:hypothetical protein
MQRLVPFLGQDSQTALFEAFSVVYSRSHKSSAIKRKCVGFIMAVSGTVGVWCDPHCGLRRCCGVPIGPWILVVVVVLCV